VPPAYKEKIEKVPGVKAVGYSNWFGGMYNNDPKNFIANYAIGPDNYFDLFPEYLIPADQKEQFWKFKDSAIAGRKVANRMGWKIGDPIRLTGMIYPGEWDFVLRAIYTGDRQGVDETALMFRWDYFDDRLRQTTPDMAGNVGWFSVKIENPDQAAAISEAIDALFKNSSVETKTETEKSFTLNFLAMMDSIIKGLRIMSFMIIGVILLILVNTMAMSARERISEYAMLKTLGFRPFHLIGLILGESLIIALIGGGLGILISFPAIGAVAKVLQNMFAIIGIDALTMFLSLAFVIIVGLIASIFPIFRAVKLSIVDGLRHIG
jgi:putative ABC transport system permease protein